MTTLDSRLGKIATALVLSGPDTGRQRAKRLPPHDHRALVMWISSCDTKQGESLLAVLGNAPQSELMDLFLKFKPGSPERNNLLATLLLHGAMAPATWSTEEMAASWDFTPERHDLLDEALKREPQPPFAAARDPSTPIGMMWQNGQLVPKSLLSNATDQAQKKLNRLPRATPVNPHTGQPY